MHDVFWGPMAYAIVGGLAVATVLTLVFLPALYVVVLGGEQFLRSLTIADVAVTHTTLEKAR
jgi:multidrug efflux pump